MSEKKPYKLQAKVEVKSHEETDADGKVRQVVDDLEIKWVATPLPKHCEACEHRDKVSPNIPVCCHPHFLAKHESPYIPFASDEPVRPNWCPLPDRIKLSPETFAQAEKKKTRCPKCNGMLVHSIRGKKCNTCGWKPENDE